LLKYSVSERFNDEDIKIAVEKEIKSAIKFWEKYYKGKNL